MEDLDGCLMTLALSLDKNCWQRGVYNLGNHMLSHGAYVLRLEPDTISY